MELKEAYNFVYKCRVCKEEYGSDQIERGKHLCPRHDFDFRRKHRSEEMLLKAVGAEKEKK